MKKNSPEKASESKNAVRLNRRTFVKLLPAGAASVVAAEAAEAKAKAVQQAGAAQPTGKVTTEALRAALQVTGLEFTDAQLEMALAGANRHLDQYEALRKIDVPLDTEPATTFRPALPGKKFNIKAAKLRLGKVELPKFSALEDLAFATTAQLAELLRTRRVSSTELTKMYLARLKKYGPKLNCVITLTEQLALEQAAQADDEIKRGKYRGPLHGVPWGAKDLFATKGIPTTWGAEPYRNQVIDYDATVVARLRAAGAVLLAKLSMGALAQGGLWFGGMTKNPWKIENTSSGSSAGSASATSAGLVGFSLGTETLGSIISPSSTCGVVGLRPTYGRVSRYGAMGLSWTMDKIGPICRGVEDCALVLDAIYGPDGHDTTVASVPFTWTPDVPLSKLRFGYLQGEFDQLTGERKAVYEAALDVLRKAGAKLEPVELPKFSTQSLRIILEAEAATAFDDLTRSGGINQLSGQSPNDWPNTFRTARFIPAVEYIRAQRARTLLMREMDQLMAQWDLFASPAPGSASLLVTNLTGHPAITLPCGIVNGLPAALMFTGRLYEEGTPLAAARALEQATEWHKQRPPMDWA